jgi:hypothetical protein
LRSIPCTGFIAPSRQSSSGIIVVDTEKNGPGGVSQESEIIAHLRMIELQYQVEIVNKNEIADRILSRTRDTVTTLSIALSLNNWVAISGLSGKIEIPTRVLDSIIDHALEKRVI